MQDNKDQYILTACGFARLSEAGEVYDERVYDGMPVHRPALIREKHPVMLSYDRVYTLLLALGPWLRNGYDRVSHQHGWLKA